MTAVQNPPKKTYFVSTFYRFTPFASPEQVKLQLEEKALSLNVRGLIIIGTEGLNATASADDEANMKAFKAFICQLVSTPNLFFKDSVSSKNPFRRFKVKIREEIVTLGTPELIPPEGAHYHLSPTEWNHVLENEKDFLLIDTRNWYETKIGTFKGAVNPGIDKFTEFPTYVEKHQIPKDKKMLIFCTGGIRCEKGILELQRQGFDNVYQLEGGIINYLQQFPNKNYEGECFVFDHRVALDQNLKPTEKYGLCPHCGQPSIVEIQCKRCDTEELICEECHQLDFKKDTCSKNCSYQFELHPDRKAPKQDKIF